MGTVRAKINPELLLWARETVGYDLGDAAKKMNISSTRLESWEKGELIPTFKQLLKASDVYKRPVGVFYFTEPPKEEIIKKDFRKLHIDADTTLTPNVNLEIRRARYRRKITLELGEYLGLNFRTKLGGISIEDDLEIAAGEYRELLGVSISTQKQWGSNSMALREWKISLENIRILVFQNTLSIDLHEMRGIALFEKILPIIIINAQDSIRGRVFTLFHEFAHLLLSNHPTYKNLKPDNKSVHFKIEFFCNQFAAAFLLPKEDFLNEPLVVSCIESGDWSIEKLHKISRKYSVSMEVVLRRAFGLKLFSKKQFEKSYADLQKEYLKQLEVKKQKQGGGAPPYYYMLLARNGYLFSRVVVQAFNENKISLLDASQYLHSKTNQVENIQKVLSGVKP